MSKCFLTSGFTSMVNMKSEYEMRKLWVTRELQLPKIFWKLSAVPPWETLFPNKISFSYCLADLRCGPSNYSSLRLMELWRQTRNWWMAVNGTVAFFGKHILPKDKIKDIDRLTNNNEKKRWNKKVVKIVEKIISI